jgi:methyl-accepting chemotaxis protein
MFSGATKFVALAVCLSALGGYLLSQLFLEVDVSSAKRSVQLLEIEEHLDDAAIGLGRQIQEWKDMLLRADDDALYSKHQQGFKESSIAVQYALMKAKTLIVEIGMETADIDQLIAEHRSLLAEYLQAYAGLKSDAAESRIKVDRKVLGVDRALQARIVQLKSGISEYAKQQLARAPQTQGDRNIMVGLLGAVSLMLMAGLGFVSARRAR